MLGTGSTEGKKRAFSILDMSIKFVQRRIYSLHKVCVRNVEGIWFSVKENMDCFGGVLIIPSANILIKSKCEKGTREANIIERKENT